MHYRITPFNLSALLLVVFAIYSYVTAPSGGDGLVNFWVIPMILLALVFAGVDYYLQSKKLRYLYLCIGQSVVVCGLLGLAYFNNFINF